MPKEKDEEEIVESQKLSARDKKEIQEGACVNCAAASIVLTLVIYILMIVM